MNVQPILNEIANYIEEHGWIQHRDHNIKGECCLWWACNRVVKDFSLQYQQEVYDEIIRKIYSRYPNTLIGLFSITEFNDLSTTKIEDVLEILQPF